MQIARKPLVEALERLERTARKAGLHARLAADDDIMTLSGGTVEAWLDLSTPADISLLAGDWSTVVPVTALRDVARVLSDDTLTLEPRGSQLHISAGGFSGAINLADGDAVVGDLIDIAHPAEYAVALDAHSFGAAVRSTVYACAVADFQAAFRGALVTVSPNSVTLAGTDGYRLARTMVDAKRTVDHAEGLVPHRALVELGRVCDTAPADTELLLHFAQNHGDDAPLLFAKLGDRYQARFTLMGETFPEYQRVIPTRFALTARVQASHVLDAVKRVSIFADARSTGVRLEINGSSMQVTADGPAGQAVQELDVVTVDGAPITRSVKAPFLLQAFDSMGDREVEMRFGDGGEAAPMTLAPVDDAKVFALIVPLRTDA